MGALSRVRPDFQLRLDNRNMGNMAPFIFIFVFISIFIFICMYIVLIAKKGASMAPCVEF